MTSASPAGYGGGGRAAEAPRAIPLILIPILDDWEAAAELLEGIDRVLTTDRSKARVVLIDDGSRLAAEPVLAGLRPQALLSVEVLRLRCNLGHQRAIAIGLSWVEAGQSPPEFTVVMDGDGQDDPADLPRLLELARRHPGEVVFAARARRVETLGFRVGYNAYRLLHRLLTGRSVRVGNFSVVPLACLRRLVGVSDLWNHYAAAVLRSRVPYRATPVDRADRLHGESKMNLVSLTVHGLSALSVQADVVSVRLLIATGLTVGGLVAATVAGAAVHLFTDLAVPRWAVIVGVVALILLVEGVMLATLFALMALQSRASMTFVPSRDYRHFLQDEPVTTIWRLPPVEGEAAPLTHPPQSASR